MLVLLAIAFPLLVTLLHIKFFPYTLNDFFTPQEQTQLKQNVTPITKDQHRRYNYYLMGGLIIFGTPLACALYYLIKLADQSYPDVLFANYAWSNWVFSLIPALFLSILSSFEVYLRHTYKTKGIDQVREFLQVSMEGIPNYISIKYYKSAVLCAGIVLSLINFIAADTFIRVNPNNIYYSHFSSLQTHSMSYDQIDCITRYSKRIAPIGSIVNNPHLDIHMKDGTVIDTFYLLERKHHREFFDAVEEAAKRGIPYFEVKSAKTEEDNHQCEQSRSSNERYMKSLNKGYDNAQNEMYDTAIEYYLAAEQEKPDKSEPHVYLGDVYTKAGDLPNAIKHLKRAIALGNKRAKTYEQLAWTYLKYGDKESALSHYSKTIELNPKNATAHLNRAGILWGKGERNQSISDLRKSCNLGNREGCIMLKKLEHN